MRQHRNKNHGGQERWLVSYADFITLLFAFFVVLFATSKVDQGKRDNLATAIQSAFHGNGTSPLSGQIIPTNGSEHEAVGSTLDASDSATKIMAGELRTALTTEIDQKVISLESGSGDFTLSLKEIGFFDSGRATVRPESLASIERIAAVLTSYSNLIRIEGHTDDLPIANARFASNWELSAARAIEITRLLTVRFGIEPARLSVAGFAEYKPIEPNLNPAGRAANRRVDIVIIGAIARPGT